MNTSNNLTSHNKSVSRNITQLFRYGLVSLGGYASIFLLMFVFVDLLRISKVVAFVIVYIFVYVAAYFINLKYLFRADHSWLTVIKFVCYIVLFIVLGSFIFVFIERRGVHYLLATFLTAAMLFLFRFWTCKFIVFK